MSAGAVILREIDGALKIALTHEKIKNEWSLPKGHVEPGETIEQTALREIHEEAGLSQLQLIRYLGSHTQEKGANETLKRKTIHYYLAYALGNELQPTPLWDHKYNPVRWVPPQEALMLIRNEGQRTFLKEQLAPLFVSMEQLKSDSA
jgi:8-oxo-dGTP pyrophosphatase MutT (NUDIX family)